MFLSQMIKRFLDLNTWQVTSGSGALGTDNNNNIPTVAPAISKEATIMSDSQLSHPAEVHQVHDRRELLDAISTAGMGDTIVIAKESDYGHIRVVNKSGLRIKSKSKQLSIQANLSIDGNSSQIIIENMNLWNDNSNQPQVIILGKQCKNVIIRHCIVSSFPVSMNTLRDKYAGEPKNWINGIRVLGEKCDVTNNVLVNVKLGIIGSGENTVIKNNVIQYFSEDAIRAQQHHVMVLKNHIYDSVLSHPGEAGHRDAIQLIPPEHRYQGGELRGVEVIGNVVRSQNRSTSVPKHMQGILQGIFGSDGYFVDITIADNSLVLNSDHGITLNGVNKLQLSDNKVIASPTNRQFTPGIKLYLTRLSTTNPPDQQWLATKNYSVRYNNNQAPIFNLPDEAYIGNDQGHNHFARLTHKLARGHQPKIIRESIDTTPREVVLPPPLPRSVEPESKPESPAARPSTSTVAKAAAHLHRVTNARELIQAIRMAKPGDTILIARAGNYGHVGIVNKSRLRIKSFNTDIPIQISIVIDGTSNNILLENMQLWNNNVSRRYIIITGKSTANIAIRNCILSTVRVNRNTMRRAYAGNPQQWISGIRMLGRNGQIISNFLMNLKMGVLETGPNTLVQHNLVQFYSEDAIRASHHGVKVLHNNIYDSVAANPGQSAHKDAIQLIPPFDRYNGGKLENVQIIGNIIQSYTQPPVIPAHQRGIVQGIFGSDGYFINTVIAGNTVMVNSDHGITLNGVRNLQLKHNRIVDLTLNDHFNPGIKLYLTRISQHGQQRWMANHPYSPYSVKISSNQGPTLNIPNEAYSIQDQGNNHFTGRTHNLARGHNPIIIRGGTHSTTPQPPVVTSPIVNPSDTGNTSGSTVYSVTNKTELEKAVHVTTSGDTIVFEKAGHYGQIRLTNKTGIRLRAASADIAINANILIDGRSKNITIENLNIWFSERNWKPVILTGPETANITVRNCLISSYQVTRSDARNQMTGSPKNWVAGIWLRGLGNEVLNNHIVNVRVGVVSNGSHVLMQNNLIQYYSDSGIRVINDSVEITHNNIYDAIAMEPESRRLLTGIQLIPAEDRFDGGSIKGIKITDNVIQAKNSGSPTTEEMQGSLQGITMHDGYVSGMVLNSNTVVVNTEHGITINGASGLSLNGNRVFDSRPGDRFIPGIKLYYTRTINVKGNRQQTWRTGRNYSVSYSNNQSPLFNVPDAGYEINDGGGNSFRTIRHNRARGINPVFAS